MHKFPELIVHIGAGKTGSTSVQFSLRKSMPALKEKGVGYLGLMLEYAQSAQGRPWALEGAPQRYFNSAEPERTDTAVLNALRNELRLLGAAGYTQVVWSNEAFLTRSDRILPLLKKIEAEGVSVRPICYVRRHDDWARSGYVQFGIKFKTYEGALRNFSDWSAAYDMAYHAHLLKWQKDFPALEIFNFDALEDVSAHFMRCIGCDDLTVVRANDRPSNALLAAWAVFNGQRNSTVLPGVFQNLAAKLKVLASQQKDVPPLSDLLPTKDQLKAVQDTYQQDLDKVNSLLAQQGQPPMAYGDVKEVDASVDDWEMKSMMLTMIMSLQQQVADLETKLSNLEQAAEQTPAPKDR